MERLSHLSPFTTCLVRYQFNKTTILLYGTNWKGYQIFPLCLTYKQRTVSCVLPLILSMLSLKTSIEGFGQSYYHMIPQDTAGYCGVAHYPMFDIDLTKSALFVLCYPLQSPIDDPVYLKFHCVVSRMLHGLYRNKTVHQ